MFMAWPPQHCGRAEGRARACKRKSKEFTLSAPRPPQLQAADAHCPSCSGGCRRLTAFQYFILQRDGEYAVFGLRLWWPVCHALMVTQLCRGCCASAYLLCAFALRLKVGAIVDCETERGPHPGPKAPVTVNVTATSRSLMQSLHEKLEPSPGKPVFTDALREMLLTLPLLSPMCTPKMWPFIL